MCTAPLCNDKSVTNAYCESAHTIKVEKSHVLVTNITVELS